jgi:MFS family permease
VSIQTPSGRSSHDIGFVTLLSESNLRRLWLTQVCSSAGESLSQIAMPLLVYELSGSARMVGLIALVLILPRVVLAPVTGLLADRVDRRRLMMGADATRLLLVSLVPLGTAIWQLALLAMAIAVGNAAGRPAELAALPSVAGPDRLVAALSLVQVSNGIIRIAVPAAGAGLIAAAGPAPVFWVQAACFAGSIAALRRLHIPSSTPSASNTPTSQAGLLQSARDEMWSGLRAIRAIPVVRGVTLSEAIFQLATSAMTVAGLVYTQETLDLGGRASAAFAFMTTFMAMGAVRGALVAHWVARRIGRRRMMALGYLGPFFLVAAAFQPDMPIIYAAWFGFGWLDALAVISFQAYLAEAVPAGMRGRVYAAWGAVVALASALAYYGMGWVTPWLGAPATLALAGLAVGIGAPTALWLTAAVRGTQDDERPASRIARSPR